MNENDDDVLSLMTAPPATPPLSPMTKRERLLRVVVKPSDTNNNNNYDESAELKQREQYEIWLQRLDEHVKHLEGQVEEHADRYHEQQQQQQQQRPHRPGTPQHHRRKQQAPRRPSTPTLHRRSHSAAPSSPGYQSGEHIRYNSQAPFLERVMNWHHDKQARIDDRMLDHIDEQQQQQQPQQQQHQVRARVRRQRPSSAAAVESARHRSKVRAFVSAREIVQQREQQIQAECTFRPAISTKSQKLMEKARARIANGPPAALYTHHRSLSREPASPPPPRSPKDMDDEDECTFTPTINRVPSSMSIAREYLSQSAFDRLSEPRYPATQNNSSTPSLLTYNDDDDDDGDGESAATAIQQQQQQLTPQQRRERLQSFLARQAQKAEEREQHLKAVKSEVEKDWGRPKINKISRQMVSSSFDERLNAYARQRRHGHQSSSTALTTTSGATNNHTQKEADDDSHQCTFRPRITRLAKQLPSRSLREMSSGDVKRRSLSIDVKRLEMEKEQGLTFRPQLRSSAELRALVGGRLNLEADAREYIEHLKAKENQMSEARDRRSHERAISEAKQCTFMPMTIKAPEFVTRIAKARARQQQQRPSSSDGGGGGSSRRRRRPDWK